MIAPRWSCLLAVCMASATACTGDDHDAAGPSTAGTVAGSAVPGLGVELPETPPGRQLRWVLEEALDAADDVYPDHFSSTFLAQVPVGELRTGIAETAISAVVQVVTSSATELVVIVTGDAGELALSIVVDADQPHLITGLLAQSAELPDPPASWEEIDAAISGAAPRFTYLASDVDDVGALTTIRTAGSSEPVALGSAFKLYVLGALVQAIDAGEIGWDDELTITDASRSLPSGELQDRPAGSTVTVREAAEKMIQISDNTATDLLIDRLGRDAVEAALTPMGMSGASQQRTLPLLTTRELFILKWGLAPGELDAYIAADVAGRREILDGLGDQLPTAGDVDAGVPVAIDDLEWFATAPEIATAHVWLDRYRDRHGFEPLAAILGTNPGVPMDPSVWSQVSFKGGSEPGLVFLGWLLHRADGRRFAVVVAASDPNGAVDEMEVASIAQGIIELVATEP